MKIKNKTNIDINIKKYRKEKGLTQQELAEKVFTTKSTISKWESGEITPSIDHIRIISKALGISVYDIIEEEKHGMTRIFAGLTKFFAFGIAWIHVDVTLLLTWMALSAAMVLMGVAFVASPIIFAILNSISTDGWTTVKTMNFAASIIYAPGLASIFLYLGAQGLNLALHCYNLSLRYFWGSKIRLKQIKFNINKKYKMAILSMVLASVITIAILIPTIAATGNMDQYNYHF